MTDYDDEEADSQDECHQEDQPPLISLHAIAGLTTNDTMRIRVQIGEDLLTALLDSRSTSNFINKDMAQQIGLHFHDSTCASVSVFTAKACSGIPLAIGF